MAVIHSSKSISTSTGKFLTSNKTTTHKTTSTLMLQVYHITANTLHSLLPLVAGLNLLAAAPAANCASLQ